MAFDPPGDIVTATSRSSSILLAEQAYVVASRNETTAAAKSRCDRTVEVTFWIDDPPAVSFCSVHCSKPPTPDSEDADLEVEPHVVAAEGRFVLLRTRFASGDGEDEYFMYKGDMKSPSLERIALPEDRRVEVCEFGILPRGDAYLLVGLAGTSLDYELHTYSSEDKTWRIEKLLNPCPVADKIIPEKVVTLGEGVLAMVDFWHGMLVCDLLHSPPVSRYVPLPGPLPKNIKKLEVFQPGANPRHFRDLTCSNGVIKFIEMEHRVIVKEWREISSEKPKAPTRKGVLYDKDLIRPKKRKGADSKPKRVYMMNGWRAATWTREIESDCWLVGCDVDTDNILVDDSFAALLSSQSDESLENLSFKNLNSAWPVLSPDGDDLLYLKTLPKFRGSNGWTVAVDLAEKTLKVKAHSVEARSLGRYIPSLQMYHPCALSKHLNMTPGIKVPAFCVIALASTSVNDRNTTEVPVAESDSCETADKHRRLSAEKVNLGQNGAQSVMQSAHILSVAEPDSYETENKRPRLSAEKVSLAQHGAQNVIPNAHISSVAEPDSCESENKRPRLSAGEVNLAQNGAQSIVQNAHIPYPRPVQNS
ncbi:hypothetical protein QOZ80_3AG0235860 [Eleusine coracana subsp. coracana]|nr:hypothetical protein QOZ80_3AG0235860 [Eleusine coracana subsp. coracana]